MFDRGHDQHTDAHQAARYKLRAGMAKAALKMKRERMINDAYGRPLSLAKEMAERHSTKTLETWARRKSSKTFVML